MDLAGKYRLIAELGQGGMATVYLAVALGSSGFRKLAVVKLIRPQYASDPDLIQMFLDEARLCARLTDGSIVEGESKITASRGTPIASASANRAVRDNQPPKFMRP